MNSIEPGALLKIGGFKMFSKKKHVYEVFICCLPLFLSACGMMPLVRSKAIRASHGMDAFEARTGNEPKQLYSGYKNALIKNQSFDLPSVAYYQKFSEEVNNLSRYGADPLKIPAEGIPYYYDERIMTMARGYLGLARYYKTHKDYARAERNALNAVSLVDSRSPSNFVIAAVKRNAWALLEEIYAADGATGAVLVAKSNKGFVEDYQGSEDGQKDRQAYYDSKTEGKLQLNKVNDVINQLNTAAADKANDALLAGLSAVNSAVASYQSSVIESDINAKGYMTDSQAGQLISLRLQKLQSDLVVEAYAKGEGKWANAINIVQSSLSPTLIRQFTDSKAGIDPVAIAEDFASQAKKLGKGNAQVEKSAMKVSSLSGDMKKARNSGDQKEAKESFQKFFPAFTELVRATRKLR